MKLENLRRHRSHWRAIALIIVMLVQAAGLHAQQSGDADNASQLPIPQSHPDDEQPSAEDEVPNPAPLPSRPAEDGRTYDDNFEDDPPGTPNIDAIRIASLSVWLVSNVALAAAYTGTGFVVDGPFAVIWGAFGGALLLAPVGVVIGASLGAILGLVLWTASADAPDRPEAESPMEVFLRQIDRLLRGAQAATLGVLITAGSASIGGLVFALGGSVAGGVLAQQQGIVRQSLYVAAGASVVATSVALGVGAYFGHVQLDRFGEAE